MSTPREIMEAGKKGPWEWVRLDKSVFALGTVGDVDGFLVHDLKALQ